MPKVIAPLFSELATGSIAGSLTFQRGSTTLQVHSKIIRQRKRSYYQILLASEYSEAIGDWRILHISIKEEFEAEAKGKPLTALNLAVRYYLYYLRENYYDVAIYDLSVYSADD